jgi:hypothetical protein
MVEIYFHFSIYLHGTVLDYVIKYRNNFNFTSQQTRFPLHFKDQAFIVV